MNYLSSLYLIFLIYEMGVIKKKLPHKVIVKIK